MGLRRKGVVGSYDKKKIQVDSIRFFGIVIVRENFLHPYEHMQNSSCAVIQPIDSDSLVILTQKSQAISMLLNKLIQYSLCGLLRASLIASLIFSLILLISLVKHLGGLEFVYGQYMKLIYIHLSNKNNIEKYISFTVIKQKKKIYI